jgi:hypothetical protein
MGLLVAAMCFVRQSAPSCCTALGFRACTGAPHAAIASRRCLLGPYREAPGRGQGWGNVLRLFGGGSELDEEGLPDVEFKLGENSLAFNVSLRCPFPVWRSVAAHFMREHAPLV